MEEKKGMEGLNLPELFKGDGDFDSVRGLGRVEVYIGCFACGGGHGGGADLIG